MRRSRRLITLRGSGMTFERILRNRYVFCMSSRLDRRELRAAYMAETRPLRRQGRSARRAGVRDRRGFGGLGFAGHVFDFGLDLRYFAIARLHGRDDILAPFRKAGFGRNGLVKLLSEVSRQVSAFALDLAEPEFEARSVGETACALHAFIERIADIVPNSHGNPFLAARGIDWSLLFPLSQKSERTDGIRCQAGKRVPHPNAGVLIMPAARLPCLPSHHELAIGLIDGAVRRNGDLVFIAVFEATLEARGFAERAGS